MFVHPELMLREQQRRHQELISAIAAERQSGTARPSRHRFTTMALRGYTYASARLRQIILQALSRHRAAPELVDPEPMVPTTPCDNPKAAATVHAVERSRAV